MLQYLKDLAVSESKRKAVFGEDDDALERWADKKFVISSLSVFII